MGNEVKIDLPVGTKVKLQGKHCVVERTDSACDLKLIACRQLCVIRLMNNYAECDKLACIAQERKDQQEVYFKEIKE